MGSAVKAEKLPHLDGLRACAAVYVVLHHAMLQFPHDGPISRVVAAPFAYGHLAVDVFIVLSGYCLALPVIRSDFMLSAPTFYARRAIRILPTYYAALVASTAIACSVLRKPSGTHWDVSIPVTINDVLSHLFLFQDVSSDTALKINHAMWSISVEWRIYLLFPLMVALWSRFGSKLMVVAAFSFSVLAWLTLSRLGLNLTPSGMSPHYVALFAMGAAAAEVRPFASCSGWLAALTIVTAVAARVRLVPFEVTDVVTGLWASCLLVVVRSERSIIRRALSARPLVFVGSFAYSIYLIHAPLIEALTRLGLSSFQYMVAAGVPVVLLLSWAFSVAFEMRNSGWATQQQSAPDTAKGGSVT